ncbi:MAG: hypothetical protein J7484_03480 [Microbacterium sp.]|nr:hypothetical protein [Microbacterium sp.]
MTTLRMHRRRGVAVRSIGYAAVLIGWTASIVVGAMLPPLPDLRALALLVHLAALVVGLGAAVMVEYTGLMWVFGRGTLRGLRENEHRLAVPAWLGYTGLLVSGAVLAPDLGNVLTLVKLGAVLLAGLNAVAIDLLVRELDLLPADMPFRRVRRTVRLWSIVSGSVSQLAWWTAVIVGAMNTASYG